MLKSVLRLLLIFALALQSGPLFALGVGVPILHSAIGEKLLMEVPINGIATEDKDKLQISLATAEIHQSLQVEPQPIHQKLRFTTVQDDSGRLILLISSTQPVNEPFLNFVFHITTPAGEMVREVSVLLDTPHAKASGKLSE